MDKLKFIENQHNRFYNECTNSAESRQVRAIARDILATHLPQKNAEKDIIARGSDDFILEREFFYAIVSFLRETYEIPEIYFFPRTDQITTGVAREENNTYILYFSKKFQQTICDICVLTSYLFFEDNAERLSKEDERRLKNILIGYIDTYANCKEMPSIDDVIYKIYAAQSAIHGASMARSILAFILCHELAHIILNHTLEIITPQDEFDADQLGCKLYFELLLSNKKFGRIKLDPSMNRAPLLLMDLLELMDYYMTNICGVSSLADKSHPMPAIRKSYLLNKYLFLYEKDSSILYQIFYEQWLSIKAHLHINAENIIANIKSFS